MARTGDFSFAKRLHYRWEYLRFFGKSQSLRLSRCSVFRIPNAAGHFRLGITVKLRCNSVERNRIKRTVRECFRAIQLHLGSYDYNVVISGVKNPDFKFVRALRTCLLEEFLAKLRGASPALRDASS